MSTHENSVAVRKAQKLFLRHHDYVRLIAFTHAPDPALAEDIVNDCFLDFINKAQQWNLEKDVRPLLTGIVRNVARRYWREHSRQLPQWLQKVYTHISERLQKDELLQGADDHERIVAALNLCIQKLSPENRHIVEQYYYHGETLVDMSKRLGKNLITLRNLAFRIRATLKQCMEKSLDKGEVDV